MREALERGAREGRSRLGDLTSDLRSSRRRTEALAERGEIVLELVRRGEIDVDELPEARNVIEHLEELDAEDAGRGDERDSSPTVAPPNRRRFDDRGSAQEDDGTVSATRWKPPTRRDKPTRVWKPNVEPPVVDELAPPTLPGHKKPRDPERKGGISFGNDDDEADLAEYMHPDDVPPKKAD